MIFILHKNLSGDPIKENKMGGECGTNGRQERGIQGFREES